MRYSALFSVTICLLLSDLTVSEGQSNERCVPVNLTNLPRFCGAYYGGTDGYFNGSRISGLDRALNDFVVNLQTESSNLDPCMPLVEQYLCYYYYPMCDLDTGEIIAVCSSSCALLLNNEGCADLLSDARDAIEQSNIVSPADSCLQTYRSFVQPPTVSLNCLAIEDSLNESLPLSCIAVESSETCRPQLPNMYYAPNTFDFTEEILTEISEIIEELDPLSLCRGFISTVVCVLNFPACNPDTGRILPICPNLCIGVDFIIGQCSLEFFANNPAFPQVNLLLNSFVCLQPETYYNFPLQYIETDPNDCSSIIQNPEITSSPSPEDDSNTGVIVAIVICGIFVVVVTVVIVLLVIYCVKRRCGKQKHEIRDPSSNEYSETPNAARFHASGEHNSHASLVLQYGSNAPSPYLLPRKLGATGDFDHSLNASKSSLMLEVNQFLQYVKDKFSEVLLPVEVISKLDLIGKGAFGVVHKGEMLASDGHVKLVAIKTIKSGSLDAMKDLVAESAIMKTFHDPNVLPLLGVCVDYDDEDVLKVVMPYMEHGDLKTFLKDSRVSINNTHEYPKDLNEEALVKMCYDIAKGMEYLAQKRFVHRDLAARNCMVDKSLSIKVADFGLTRDIYSSEYYRIEKHTVLPVKWMSIESILDGYFDEKTDVWSYGITCWEIFSLGRLPYPGVDNANVVTLLKSDKRLEKPELCQSQLYEIMQSTWKEEPEKRPSFAEIVQKLQSLCNVSESAPADEASIKDGEEHPGYIDVTA